MRYTFRDLIISGTVLLLFFVGVVLVRSRTPDFNPRAVAPGGTVVLPSPILPVTSMTEVHSPDGTLKLVLKGVTQLSGTQSVYLVTASNLSGVNRRVIYQSLLPNGTNVRIPANSWSPDNKFVFIMVQSQDGLHVLVFPANGNDSIDLSSIFREKFPNAILRDVTGWDDPALLHVMTYNADKTIGLSYWFDIWSRSFIQLAHR